MTSLITTVYAPDAQSEQIARDNMAVSAAQFREDRRIAAADCASDDLTGWLRETGWAIVAMSDGRPPRMTRLVRAALDLCTDELVWTIEMDCHLIPPTRERIEAAMGLDPRIGGIEANAVNARGRLMEPTHRRALEAPAWRAEREDLRECTALSYNATCWRRAALMAADWAALPALIKADSPLGDQLRARGWTLLLHRDAQARHVGRTSVDAWRRQRIR